MTGVPRPVYSAVVVHPVFDEVWPYAAAYVVDTWQREGEVAFVRLVREDDVPRQLAVDDPGSVRRLVMLGAGLSRAVVETMPGLREIAVLAGIEPDAEVLLRHRGVRIHRHRSEGFWGQSVAEFGLALTLCGLRRIPQLHHEIQHDLGPWQHAASGAGQFSDDPRFTNGTIAGRRVRVIGAGNIGSRYASFAAMLGADVAVWDPFAAEPAFHRAGARREHHLERLVVDAEIFAPMLPLSTETRGLVTAAHIAALPAGCLVVLVTRAGICDMAALRSRVLADELALAADVHDVEPLPLDDPLLGRHNVVHTPHVAGRTRDANVAFVAAILDQFLPVTGGRPGAP